MDALLMDKTNETDYKSDSRDWGPLDKQLFKRIAEYRQIPLKIEIPIFKPSAVRREAIHIHRLHMLDSDKYALRRVLFVQIEKTDDGETFIAKIPSLELFGVGDTQEEAITDFQLSLIEDYEILKEEKDRLNSYLRGHFAILTKILRELPCH